MYPLTIRQTSMTWWNAMPWSQQYVLSSVPLYFWSSFAVSASALWSQDVTETGICVRRVSRRPRPKEKGHGRLSSTASRWSWCNSRWWWETSRGNHYWLCSSRWWHSPTRCSQDRSRHTSICHMVVSRWLCPQSVLSKWLRPRHPNSRHHRSLPLPRLTHRNRSLIRRNQMTLLWQMKPFILRLIKRLTTS